MNFIVNNRDFLQAVTEASQATAIRVIQPILGNVLITAAFTPAKFAIQVSGSDLDTFFTSSLDGIVKKAGSFTLPAKKLINILMQFDKASDIEFSFDKKTFYVKISDSISSFNLRTLPVEEFPKEPKNKVTKNLVCVPVPTMKRALQRVLTSSATYAESVLSGVYLNVKTIDTKLFLAATDGSRLSECQIDTITAGSELETVVPASVLKKLLKLKLSLDDDIELAFDKEKTGKLFISTRTQRIITTPFSEKFPEYGKLIPENNSITMTCLRKEFFSCIKRASATVNERTNIIKLEFLKGDQNKILVSSQCPDLGDSSSVMNAIIHSDGNPVTLAFNYHYLLDAMRNLDGESLRLDFDSSLSPTILSDPGEAGYKCLVMPVQVK